MEIWYCESLTTNKFTFCIIQTMVLVLIGYLSFYFDLENFTDRAMIVLTTMLVIATITAAIQAVILITLLNLSHHI